MPGASVGAATTLRRINGPSLFLTRLTKTVPERRASLRPSVVVVALQLTTSGSALSLLAPSVSVASPPGGSATESSPRMKKRRGACPSLNDGGASPGAEAQAMFGASASLKLRVVVPRLMDASGSHARV